MQPVVTCNVMNHGELSICHKGEVLRGKDEATRAMAAANDVCSHPGKLYPVEVGKDSDGGKEWSSLVGSLMCEECFSRYKKRRRAQEGQISTSLHGVSDRPDEHCDVPHPPPYCAPSNNNGGGKLKSQSRRITEWEKNCAYEKCFKPGKSKNYIRIEEGKTSGGRDWSPLIGRVLCEACHQRFTTKGSLERTVNSPLDASARQCTYRHCGKPLVSKNFYLIEEGRRSGGQDWGSLVGRVLCAACYCQFATKGTLQRSKDPDLVEAKQRKISSPQLLTNY